MDYLRSGGTAADPFAVGGNGEAVLDLNTHNSWRGVPRLRWDEQPICVERGRVKSSLFNNTNF